MYLKKYMNTPKPLNLKCGQYKIDFVETDINQGFDL